MTRALLIALLAGCGIEGMLCALGATFGKFGPCGPASDISALLMILHGPAFSVASAISPRGSWIEVVGIIVASALLWTIAAFIIIRLVQSIRKPPTVR